MASGDKQFKQDLIVSARFKNDLPPPPFPPKFLEIDTGGLENYLTTGYASALVRREEPNIEVDAEGGMPIDMIGVPGYFLGDESVIMAPEVPPLLDPADQELLKSINQIKSETAASSISFLRKTQYLSTSATRTTNASDLFTKNSRSRQPVERKAVESPVNRDEPENVKRHVQKGFDLAYPGSVPYNDESVKGIPRTAAEKAAWDTPKHPSGNSKITVVDKFPVLPDFEAINDEGGVWHRMKFDKPPIGAERNRRDDRIDVATFQTVPNEALMAEWQAKKDAFEQDPDNYEDPGPEPLIWVMATPTSSDVTSIRKHLFDGHPDKDDPTVVQPLLKQSASKQMRIEFERKRVFHSVTQQMVDPRRLFALGLYDPNSKKNTMPPSEAKKAQESAAYFYPIADNVRFKADRSKITNPALADRDLDQEFADFFMYRPRELDPRELYDRVARQGKYDYAFHDEFAQIERDAIAYQEAQQAAEQAAEQETREDAEEADVTMGDAEAAEEADLEMDESGGTTKPSRDDHEHETNGVDGHDRRAQPVAEDSDEELLDDD